MAVHPLIKRRLTQVATVWTATGRDQYGQPTFSTPALVSTRWEKKSRRMEEAGGAARETLYRAFVWTDIEYSIGDYLYLGSSTSATPVEGAQEIIDTEVVPSLDGRYFEYIMKV